MLCEAHENQGTTRGKEKILLTSVGIESTTSGLDLPLHSHSFTFIHMLMFTLHLFVQLSFYMLLFDGIHSAPITWRLVKATKTSLTHFDTDA